MANEQLRQSLFGPSPQEIAQAQAAQQQEQAMQFAQLPAGRGGVAAAAMAGSTFGNALGKTMGGVDPQQEKAQRMQMAQQETEMQAQTNGIDLSSNPKGYYGLAAKTLQKYGLVDEAQNVMNIAQNHDLAEREMRYKETSVKGNNRFKMSGNILYDQQTGETNPVEGYQGKSTEKDSALAIAKQDLAEGKINQDEYNALEKKYTHLPEGQRISIDMAADKGALDLQNDLVKSEVTPILASGRAATATRQYASQIRTQLRSGNVQPGFAVDFRQSLATAGSFFGVDQETLTNLKSNPDDLAATRAASTAIIGGIVGSLSGNDRTSATETKLYKDAAPNMMMTAPGMDFVNEVTDMRAQWEEERAKAATDAVINADPKKPGEAINAIRAWEQAHPFAINAEMSDKLKRSFQIARKMNDKNTKPLVEAIKNNSAIAGNNYIYNGTLVTFLGKNPKTGGIKYEVVK